MAADLNHVQRARKDQGECERCGTLLPAGSEYRWFQAYRGYKHIRCMAPGCTPRYSERVTSKLSSVYAAIEDAEASLTASVLAALVQGGDTGDDFPDTLREILDGVVQVIREVADEYREASMDPNGNVFNTASEERADTLESAADELESWESSAERPYCDEHGTQVVPGCGECDDAIEDWANEVANEAIEAMNGLELG